MNRPSMPPDLASVLAGSTVEQWQRLHSAPLPAGYPHWESVRHKSPPAGLTVEEWWAAIQLQRSSQRRPLPLKDVDGREFSYVLTEDIQRQLHEIDSAVRGDGSWPPFDRDA